MCLLRTIGCDGTVGPSLPTAKTKNGVKGAVVHQEAIGGALCPVAALAQRIHNIRGTSQSCPISMVFHHYKQPTRVSDSDITIAVRWGAMNDNLLEQVYTQLSVIPQSQGRWSHGSQACRCHHRHHNANQPVDLEYVHDIYPRSNWRSRQGASLENVKSTHVSQRRVTTKQPSSTE